MLPRSFKLRRFVVADRSMEPALVGGQAVIATRRGTAEPGQIRIFEHPLRPGFWLIKRVERIPETGRMWMLSDNRSLSTTDSRELGTVPIDGSYRVLCALPTWLVRIDSAPERP